MNRAALDRAASFAGIVLPVAVALAMPGYAYAGDLPAAHSSTAVRTIDQFEKNQGTFPGYRRNHAKGVCVSGYFRSSGKAARYSAARVFVPGQRTPVIGRFSIPGGNPYTWDESTAIRGIALQLTSANGEQWRTAMNAVPAFPVATPQANYAFVRLQQPDPATGNPDPKKLAAFFATHPKADAFRVWDRTTTPSTSYATERYNSLNTFILVDANDARHAVRWSMRPLAGARDDEHARRDKRNYLAVDLRRRLSAGPLKWHLTITFANPDDPILDAAQAWSGSHRHIDAGTLVIEAMQAQKTGACRDINFNPLVLPPGIQASADPLLELRAKAYAESHRRRINDATQHAGAVVVGP